jgi:hypothetical protein
MRFNWFNISFSQKLSEDLIREFKDVVDWRQICEFQILSEDFIREFKDVVDWNIISQCQRLSENFIREFQNKVDWQKISTFQRLSELFIAEFKDKVCWHFICIDQKLSERFIREFKDKVDWDLIAVNQPLNESFIEEFQDQIDWVVISAYQKLSDNFIKKLKDNSHYFDNIKFYSHNDHRTKEDKIEEIKNYALFYKLEFDGEYLYAYRNHDQWGRGHFNKTISYEKNKYYRDWRCDLNPNNQCSFGLGICPEGNTKIKIKVDDWGTIVSNDTYGKARVWGFEIIQ